MKPPQSLAALIVPILACLLTACASAVTPATDSEQLEAARAAVLARTLEWHDAWEDLEPDAVLALYAPDVRYYWFGQEMPSLEAFESVLHNYIIPENYGYSLDPISPHIQVLSPTSVVSSYLFKGTVNRRDGTIEPVEAAVSLVFQKRKGHWWIVHVHESGSTTE